MSDVPDPRPLAWGRIALGALFLLRTTPILLPLRLDFSVNTFPLLGWPTTDWHGAAIGVSLPVWALQVACIVRTLSAVCFMLGVHTRPAGIVAGVSGYLVLVQDPFGFVATLHLLYQGTILLALGDAGASLAVRPEPARHVASSLRLIRLFLSSIYLWAGLVKLRPDWLDGRTLALFQRDGAFSGPLAALVLSTPTSRAVIASTVALTELSLPALLWWRRTARVAPFIALGLHASIELCAHPDLLGWEMAALLLCLWPSVATHDARSESP